MTFKHGDGEFRERKRQQGKAWSVRLYVTLDDGRRIRVAESVGRSWGKDAITRQEAERRAERIVAAAKLGQYVPKKERKRRAEQAATETPTVPYFGPFADEWLERQKTVGGRRGGGLTDRGYEFTRWKVDHLTAWFGGLRLDQVTEEEIDRFAAAKLAAPIGEGGLNGTSVNKMLSTLRAILRAAVRYRHIDRNTAEGASVAQSKYVAAHLETAAQITALLDAASTLDRGRRGREGHGRAVLSALVFGGLRIGEALALRWQDVDLGRGVIRVRASKTDAGIRRVNILAPLRDDLISLKLRRPNEPGDLVFATATGKPDNPSNIRNRVLADAIEKANEKLAKDGEEPISESLTPHGLRHTYASILVAMKEDPRYVMGQIGHAHAGFTLGHYSKEMGRRDGEPERLRALVTGEPIEASTTDENAPAAA